MRTEIVLSQERSPGEHGQHVVEPGPDASKVKLALLVQVPKGVSQAQIQVGGAPELGVSCGDKVSGSAGPLGAQGARHRALGGQRGGRPQTGRSRHRHPGYWRPFFRLGALRKENILIHISLGGG